MCGIKRARDTRPGESQLGSGFKEIRPQHRLIRLAGLDHRRPDGPQNRAAADRKLVRLAEAAVLAIVHEARDRQARVFELMRAGKESEAEAIYREILPGIVFVMQSIDHLVCYGKRIAALRLQLGSVYDRPPAQAPDSFGLDCTRRYATALGPLA